MAIRILGRRRLPKRCFSPFWERCSSRPKVRITKPSNCWERAHMPICTAAPNLRLIIDLDWHGAQKTRRGPRTRPHKRSPTPCWASRRRARRRCACQRIPPCRTCTRTHTTHTSGAHARTHTHTHTHTRTHTATHCKTHTHCKALRSFADSGVACCARSI